jgi:hypothetical protein
MYAQYLATGSNLLCSTIRSDAIKRYVTVVASFYTLFGPQCGGYQSIVDSLCCGRRTLGARIAPSGNWNDEYNFRRKRELSLCMAGSSLAKETARLGYRTMVCSALEYPLTITQFTQEQCDKITSPILRSCMSQMGYNQNSPKEVVYGPVEMGGFG